jgi:hypothetical protein
VLSFRRRAGPSREDFDSVFLCGYVGDVGTSDQRLKPLLNQGEGAVLEIAGVVCDATGTKAFAKFRIADAVRIDNSGISNELYSYALSAHFDVLVSKDNKAFLAIEFDGDGHDPKNDTKKAALCDQFGIPMVRVTQSHLNAKLFEDTSIAFFIWQLFCVDAFLDEYGSDPYEPYDPAWFVSVAGKTRNWPFAYAERWRGRLKHPFMESLGKFDLTVRHFYEHGLLQFGTMTFTCHKGLEYRSIYAQLVGKDLAIFGEAQLGLEVHGLHGRRLELFGEIASFVEGLAAEQMYWQGIAFLEGEANTVSTKDLRARVDLWEAEGFNLRRALNFRT